MARKFRSKICCLFFLFLGLGTLPAQADSKASTWLMSLTRFTFTEEVRGFLDLQPRLAVEDPKPGQDGHFDTLLIRGALGYQLDEDIGIYQGYAAIPAYDPTRVEHRSFQEMLAQQPLSGALSLTHRLRFEQRFLENIDDLALRVRYFARMTHPIPSIHENISLAVNEEVFINANDADEGPQAGFNQNRFFLGLNYKIDDSLSVDCGYQNQFVDGRKGADDTVNHVAFLGFISKVSFVD